MLCEFNFPPRSTGGDISLSACRCIPPAPSSRIVVQLLRIRHYTFGMYNSSAFAFRARPPNYFRGKSDSRASTVSSAFATWAIYGIRVRTLLKFLEREPARIDVDVSLARSRRSDLCTGRFFLGGFCDLWFECRFAVYEITNWIRCGVFPEINLFCIDSYLVPSGSRACVSSVNRCSDG